MKVFRIFAPLVFVMVLSVWCRGDVWVGASTPSGPETLYEGGDWGAGLSLYAYFRDSYGEYSASLKVERRLEEISGLTTWIMGVVSTRGSKYYRDQWSSEYGVGVYFVGRTPKISALRMGFGVGAFYNLTTSTLHLGAFYFEIHFLAKGREAE